MDENEIGNKKTEIKNIERIGKSEKRNMMTATVCKKIRIKEN